MLSLSTGSTGVIWRTSGVYKRTKNVNSSYSISFLGVLFQHWKSKYSEVDPKPLIILALLLILFYFFELYELHVLQSNWFPCFMLIQVKIRTWKSNTPVFLNGFGISFQLFADSLVNDSFTLRYCHSTLWSGVQIKRRISVSQKLLKALF